MSLKLLLMGILLFLISFLMGIGAMYYESPRLVVNESFRLERNTSKSFTLSPPPTSLHYDISCQSPKPLGVTLSFLDEEGSVISTVDLTGNGSARLEDHEHFARRPIEVSIASHTDEVRCHLMILYASFDEGILLLMVTIQLLTSLLAISLLFSYYLRSSREKRVSRSSHRAI